MKPETRLVSRIIKVLRLLPNSWWVKIHGSPFQVSGIPDILGCYRGRFVGFEAKLPDDPARLTARQGWMLNRIEEAGGIASVVSSPDEAVGILQEAFPDDTLEP